MRLLSLFVLIVVEVCAQSPGHPLDSLNKSEYWTVYDVLEHAGQVTPTTLFASVLLHPPAKSAVLSYRPGQPFAREADVVLLRGEKTFAARVDIVGKKVLSFEELPGVQAPILASELFGEDEAIKSDPRVVEALKKRGITNLGTVSCDASLLLGYRRLCSDIEGSPARVVGFRGGQAATSEHNPVANGSFVRLGEFSADSLRTPARSAFG